MTSNQSVDDLEREAMMFFFHLRSRTHCLVCGNRGKTANAISCELLDLSARELRSAAQLVAQAEALTVVGLEDSPESSFRLLCLTLFLRNRPASIYLPVAQEAIRRSLLTEAALMMSRELYMLELFPSPTQHERRQSSRRVSERILAESSSVVASPPPSPHFHWAMLELERALAESEGDGRRNLDRLHSVLGKARAFGEHALVPDILHSVGAAQDEEGVAGAESAFLRGHYLSVLYGIGSAFHRHTHSLLAMARVAQDVELTIQYIQDLEVAQGFLPAEIAIQARLVPTHTSFDGHLIPQQIEAAPLFELASGIPAARERALAFFEISRRLCQNRDYAGALAASDAGLAAHDDNPLILGARCAALHGLKRYAEASALARSRNTSSFAIWMALMNPNPNARAFLSEHGLGRPPEKKPERIDDVIPPVKAERYWRLAQDALRAGYRSLASHYAGIAACRWYDCASYENAAEAVEMAEAYGVIDTVLTAKNIRAALARDSGDLPWAIVLWREIYGIAALLGDLDRYAMAVGNSGTALEEQGDLEGALRAYQLSVAVHQKRGDDTNATIQQGNLEKLVLAAMAVYDEDDDPDIRETEPLDDEERRRRSAEVLARISALPWVAQGEWLRILGPIAGSPTEERLLEWTRESQSKASMIRFELGRIMHELRHSLRSGSSWKEDLVAARDLARQEPILLMRTKALARIGKRLGARGHKEESADVLLEALEGGRLLSQDLPPRSAGLFAPRRWGSLYVAAIEALIERGEDGRVVAELAEEVRNLGWRRYLQTSDEPRDHSCAIYEVMPGHRNVYYRYSSEKLGSGYQCLCSRQDFLAAMTQLDAWVSNRTTPISSILETISKLLIPECVRVLAEDSRVLFVPYGMARNVPWLALPVSESRPVARMWRAGVMPSLGAAAQRGVEGPTLGMGRAFLRVLWPHEQEMFPLSDELGVHGFRRGSAAPVVWDGAHLARSCVLGSLLEHEIVCIMAHGSNASKDPLGLPKMLLSVLDPNPRTILSPLDLFRVSIPRTGVFWASCHGGRAAAPEILNPLALPLAFSDALIACGAAWVISGLWQLSVGLAMDLAARLMNAPNDGVYAAIQSVFPESVKDAKAMARVAPLTFNGVPPQG